MKRRTLCCSCVLVFVIHGGCRPESNDAEPAAPTAETAAAQAEPEYYAWIHDAVAAGDAAAVQRFIRDRYSLDRFLDGVGTPLGVAYGNDNVEIFRLLLDGGADPNALLKKNWPILHDAAEQGKTEYVDLLAEAGANLNVQIGKPSEYTTAHSYAARAKQWEVCARLRELGAETTIHEAATFGDLEGVKAHLAKDRNLLDRVNYPYVGMTPLAIAVKHGHNEIVEFLLSKGPDVDQENWDGYIPIHHAIVTENEAALDMLLGIAPHLVRTQIDVWDLRGDNAFHFAARGGNPSIIRKLFDHAPDALHAENKFARTPVHEAAQHGRLDAIKLLLEIAPSAFEPAGKEGLTPIHTAALGGKVALLEFFNERGMDLDRLDALGRSPLHFAAKGGEIDAATYLLDHGAELARRDNDGRTALFYAAEIGNIPVLDMLIAKGAPTDVVSKNGTSVLHGACAGNQVDVLKLLLEHGAGLESRDPQGRTPLLTALEHRAKNAALFLLERGANANVADDHGESAIYLAARHGDVELAKAVHRAGADPNGPEPTSLGVLHGVAEGPGTAMTKWAIRLPANVNKQGPEGQTPLHLAAQHQRDFPLQYLLARGANPNLEDHERLLPYHYANRTGNKKITDALREVTAGVKDD